MACSGEGQIPGVGRKREKDVMFLLMVRPGVFPRPFPFLLFTFRSSPTFVYYCKHNLMNRNQGGEGRRWWGAGNEPPNLDLCF